MRVTNYSARFEKEFPRGLSIHVSSSLVPRPPTHARDYVSSVRAAVPPAVEQDVGRLVHHFLFRQLEHPLVVVV